ncbi:chlorophyllase-2, chloroplastic [Cucurbita pepo subsp. pepo]|uniref:chlorophyllase-2, chloroplastic n=1 Tax=Cucurbita pepo subsp. pepo TaxID=3664 RepID=UPI000C9D842A|nr:chlorophyllase-2, chloroplastic [Cucurbita pepo subsp. pepo]
MAMATASFPPPSATAASATSSIVFEIGKFNAVLEKVESAGCCSSGRHLPAPPPKPLLIGRPSDAGEFQVLLLIHGYLLYNTFYSQLIHQIASHGFIVIAPQLYSVAGPDTSEEIKATAAVINWLPEGLRQHLPPHVNPNLNKIALSGHSRGGKTSFALALALAEQKSPKLSALIGLDPVDGTGSGKQTHPPVLKYIPQSFDLGVPVLVIGSGLGELKRNPLFPPCAPKGINHEEFFEECRNPAHYFVAKDYGHLDLLDDETGGLRGKASYCLCKNGESREPMRRFVGGAVVAFLKAYLNGEDGDLRAIEDGDLCLPVHLQTVESLL